MHHHAASVCNDKRAQKQQDCTTGKKDYLTPTESITMPPKAAAAPVPESVLKKQAATKKSAEDRAKAQAARKQVCFTT